MNLEDIVQEYEENKYKLTKLERSAYEYYIRKFKEIKNEDKN